VDRDGLGFAWRDAISSESSGKSSQLRNCRIMFEQPEQVGGPLAHSAILVVQKPHD